MKNKYKLISLQIGIGYLLLIPFFGIIYYYLSVNVNDSFNRLLSFEDSIYFSVVTLTTLGYGDILPQNTSVKLAVCFQSFLGVLLIGLFLNALSSRQEREAQIKEEKKKLIVRRAIYQDISLYLQKFIFFWNIIYDCSVKDREVSNYEELFNEDVFKEMYDYLDIRKEATFIPKKTWAVYLEEQVKDMKTLGDKIILRYSFEHNSELLFLTHELSDEGIFFKGLGSIPEMRARNKKMGILELRPSLSEYCPLPKEKDLDKVKKIIKLVLEEEKELSKQGLENLRKIKEKIKDTNPREPYPRSRLE